MKTDLTKEERFALAAKLEGILGADLDYDEEQAIEQAIALICPEYAQGMEDQINEAAKWFEDQMKGGNA